MYSSLLTQQKVASMADYKAPLRDIEFSLNEVLDYGGHLDRHYGTFGFDMELVSSVASEFGKFCETELAPLNRTADEEGCTWTDGHVATPTGFREAYKQYSEDGWSSLAGEPELGGQGLPTSLSMILSEMTVSANTSFALYTGGLAGAIETLSSFGTDEQRVQYEEKLVAGEWNATMCLTEPHCGTDLGLLKTKAVPKGDGKFAITGTKIFITAGEHDLTDNIVHLVLARMPDSPPGTQGISLFIVPKTKLDQKSEPNGVSCGSIEHKMGIKGSATCVMNFDAAEGELLGEPNRGLHAMFTFINASRVRAAFQGVSHAELGFQKSLAYARERLQMRSASGVKNPEGPADPIIVHADVRRMLLTQKVLAEGSRLMLHHLTMQLDVTEKAESKEERTNALRQLELLTPIAKGFVTEIGFECANHGLQCFGGHGYIREWGLEQNVRDARIATLYEGTTGIQGLDLIGRKVIGSGGALLTEFCCEVEAFCSEASTISGIEGHLNQVRGLLAEWQECAALIAERSAKNPDETGGASVQFLMYSGYVCLAYFWLRSEAVALEKSAQANNTDPFYGAKIASAAFYFDQVLPRTLSCVAAIKNGASSMMALHEDHFAF